MINPQNITALVRRSLNFIDIHEPALETLIKGTFLAESNLESLFDTADNRHGLMMMHERDIHWLFEDYIKYKPHLVRAIAALLGLNVRDTDTETFIEELDYNIAFMVLVMYAWYDSKNMDIIEDDLEKLAMFYRNNYSDDRQGDIDEFVQRYQEVFVN